jgi:hypothetical protein
MLALSSEYESRSPRRLRQIKNRFNQIRYFETKWDYVVTELLRAHDFQSDGESLDKMNSYSEELEEALEVIDTAPNSNEKRQLIREVNAEDKSLTDILLEAAQPFLEFYYWLDNENTGLGLEEAQSNVEDREMMNKIESFLESEGIEIPWKKKKKKRKFRLVEQRRRIVFMDPQRAVQPILAIALRFDSNSIMWEVQDVFRTKKYVPGNPNSNVPNPEERIEIRHQEVAVTDQNTLFVLRALTRNEIPPVLVRLGLLRFAAIAFLRWIDNYSSIHTMQFRGYWDSARDGPFDVEQFMIDRMASTLDTYFDIEGDPLGQYSFENSGFTSCKFYILEVPEQGPMISPTSLISPPPSDIGFCADTRGKKITVHDWILLSAKGKDGECFFRAFASQLREKYDKGWNTNNCFPRANSWLEAHNLPILEGGVRISDVPNLVNYLGYTIEIFLFDEENQLDLFDVFLHSNEEQIIQLVLYEEHWYTLKGQFAFSTPRGNYCGQCHQYFKRAHTCTRIQCKPCGQWVKPENMDHHFCSLQRVNFRNRIAWQKEGRSKVTANVCFKDKFVSNDNVIFFDIETHLNESKTHLAYAAGWLRKYTTDSDDLDKYYFSYGYECVSDFVAYLNSLRKEEAPKVYIITYNGSYYDNHFLLKELVKRAIMPKMVLQPGGGIISMSWKNQYDVQIKAIDLLRFLVRGSLRNNCKAFQLDIEKGDFPYDFLNELCDINYEGPIPPREYWKEPPENYDENTPVWNLKEECLKYLKTDVMCTAKLWDKLAWVVFDALNIDLRQYITTSQLSFEVWAAFISPNRNSETSRIWRLPVRQPNWTPEGHFDVELPNESQYQWAWKATYGGLCFNWCRYFESANYQQIIDKEVGWKEVEDFILNLDVVSLYPAAMANHLYPVGPSFELSAEQINYLNENYLDEPLPIGIFEVEYIPNKHLLTPVLSDKKFKRMFNGDFVSQGLSWDLNVNRGIYTNVDLQEAIRAHYKIKIIGGIYWKDQQPIFKDFIEHIFELKLQGDREKNESLRMFAKTFLVALYGKMLQKPTLDTIELIRDRKKADRFLAKYNIEDIITIDEDGEILAAIFKGTDMNIEKLITKPTHLGAFVLSYSRKIMWDYMDVLDPFRLTDPELSLTNLPFYRDTDSLHTRITLAVKGRLAPYLKIDKLGALWNDDDKYNGKKIEGKIIFAIYLGPKRYFYELLGNDGQIYIKAKAAGLPQKKLTKQMFLDSLRNGPQEKIEFEGFRKIGARAADGVNQPFDIVTETYTRTMAARWEGRNFVVDSENQHSFPIGFEWNIQTEE